MALDLAAAAYAAPYELWVPEELLDALSFSQVIPPLSTEILRYALVENVRIEVSREKELGDDCCIALIRQPVDYVALTSKIDNVAKVVLTWLKTKAAPERVVVAPHTRVTEEVVQEARRLPTLVCAEDFWSRVDTLANEFWQPPRSSVLKFKAVCTNPGVLREFREGLLRLILRDNTYECQLVKEDTIADLTRILAGEQEGAAYLYAQPAPPGQAAEGSVFVSDHKHVPRERALYSMALIRRVSGEELTVRAMEACLARSANEALPPHMLDSTRYRDPVIEP